MSKLIDLSNSVFDRLTVIGISGRQNGSILWECKCNCGNMCQVLASNLKSGRQKSCGCKDKERKIRHGNTRRGHKTVEYRTWQNIKKRCYFEKDNEYDNYGARGIKVCDRWLENFENFLEDMGRRPSRNHSIDRIDGNKGYEPSNCRWATGTEQIINQKTRCDNTSGQKGVSWEKQSAKWHAYIKPGYNQKRINLGYFENLQDAVNARKQAELKYHSEALANQRVLSS